MKKLIALTILALTLSGCATCREHPVGCTVAIVAVAAVAVAASSGGGSSHGRGY